MKAPRWILAVLLVLCGANVLTVLRTTGTVNALSSGTLPEISFPPLVRIVLALVWIVVFGLLPIGLMQRRRTAFRLTAPLISLYGLSSIAWNMLFALSDYSRGGIGFQAAVTLLALIPVWRVASRRGWLQGIGANAKLDVTHD